MKKKMEERLLKIVSKVALNAAKESANTTCAFVGYQAKLPESVSKLRKF